MQTNLTKKQDINECINKKSAKLAKSLLKVKNFVELFSIDTWQMQVWRKIF